jgi:hypothetical protein
LSSVNWGQQQNLVTIISFAATGASLLLALLAIIYAFVSNSSVSQTLSSLRDMSKEVSSASAQVSHLSQNLEEHLGMIPGFMESVESQVRETKEIVLQESQKRVILEGSPEAGTLDVTETKIDVSSFINKSSLSGLLTILGFYYAHKQKSGFNLEEFAKLITIVPEADSKAEFAYIHGFLVCMTASKLIDYNLRDDHTLTVLSLHSGFSPEFIEKRLKDKKKKYDEDEKNSILSEFLEKKPQEIKRYFEVSENNP